MKSRQMSFQVKSVIAYSVFIAVLMLFLGFAFYYYNSRIYQENSFSTLRNQADKMSQQLDNYIQLMDYASWDFATRVDFVSAMTNLAYLDDTDAKNKIYISESISLIKSSIFKDSVNRNFFRLSIFNKKGDFYTSNFKEDKSPKLTQDIDEIAWIEKVRNKNGRVYIVPPHKDDWAVSNPSEVISLSREVRGPLGEVGFIEIQNKTDSLNKICTIGTDTHSDVNVLVLNDENDIIFSNRKLGPDNLKFYSGLQKKDKADVSIFNNPISNSQEIVSRIRSDYTGFSVMIIQDIKILFRPLDFLRTTTLLIGLVLTLITMLFFYFISAQLTKPLRKLSKMMEEVNIDNLPKKLHIQHDNNEIQSLNKSFLRMRERLNEAITCEIQSKSLQLRAHLDALQAQINPHFIYNILTILSNMGLEAGITEIDDTCRSISAMLRYSTSTKDKATTLRSEIDHVKNYLNLMKKRFEHKLEYTIHLDEKLLDFLMPKLVLQPLVENSINYGSDPNTGKKEIGIAASLSNNEWCIEVFDKGTGFSEETLREINSKIDACKKGIFGGEGLSGFSIGGMGIVNTFTRISLFYGKEIGFYVGNNGSKGALIRISGSFSISEEGREV